MRSCTPLLRWRPALAAICGLVWGLSACAGMGGRAPSPFDQPPGGTTTSLELSVENQNFNNVRLASVSIRGRVPIGRVSGNGRGTFRIPWSGVHELSIRMDFLAGGEYVSNRLTVSPGDRLELLITPDPRNSILRQLP